MSYTPINLNVYIAAYAGAIAGMGASERVPSNPLSSASTNTAAIAGAYAQEFDTIWNDATDVNELVYQEIITLSEATWEKRAPQLAQVTPLIPATYESLCEALIAIITASSAYQTSQGITPPAHGGSGGTLAGDVTGAIGANVVEALTGLAGVVSVPTAAIAFGATPATAGTLRFSHDTNIAGRDNANANNRNIISWGDVANDTIAIGETAIAIQANCSTFTFSNAAVIIQGTTPSTTGDFRVRHAWSLRGRRSDNAADIALVDWGNINGVNTCTIGNGATGTYVTGTTVFMNTQNITNPAASGAPTYSQASNSGNGNAYTIRAQSSSGSNGNGGRLQLRGGALNGSGLKGPISLQLNGTTETMIEIAEPATGGRRVVSLALGADITTTEMPANTGDKVIFIGNAATAPTADSVGGGILYCEAGALKYRGTAGTITTLGAA